MLSLIIGLLTFILVFICAVLIVLILAQLPKKDAGAGLAFGAGTAEAIFGAGAGTPLAQITKYCAGIFLGLALTLSALNAYRSNQGDRLLEEEAARQAAAAPETTETTDPTTPDITPIVPGGPLAPVPGAEEETSPAEGTTEKPEGEGEGDQASEENPQTETPELSEPTNSPLGDVPLTQPQTNPTTSPNPNN